MLCALAVDAGNKSSCVLHCDWLAPSGLVRRSGSVARVFTSVLTLAVLLTVVYESWARHPLAMVALHGALAAAVGIIAATAWTLIRPHASRANGARIVIFALGALLLLIVFHISPIRILLLAGLVGAVLPIAKQP